VQTLQQLAATALYELPLTRPSVRPYGGIGVAVTRFEVPGEPCTVDASGARPGLAFVAGARIHDDALWRLRPFVHATAVIGEVDLVTVGGGVLFDLGGGR
jgi:hypothetical protein